MLLISIVDQRVQSVDRVRNHIAATATITAVRAAKGHMGLSSETDRTRATMA